MWYNTKRIRYCLRTDKEDVLIIIFCPRANATGGTELLHQLGYKLNLFGFDAKMYYYGEDNGLPATHPHFVKYSVPVLDSVSDSPDHIFVYPEVMASSLEGIKSQLTHSKHVLWWLSVDNAGMTPSLEKEISEDNTLIHFVQSYYAMEYVKNQLNIPEERVFRLSDYLNYNFLNIGENSLRDDFVLYNPRKGFERTSRLIQKSAQTIKWLALSGFAPEEIPQVLQCAKVYIDFGEHPGKDRFPREAVCCGCRVITGKRGAAANDFDVPIPDRFKVDDDLNDESILDLISLLIKDYDQTSELYNDYRDRTREEFHSFETDTLITFSNLTGVEIDGTGLDGSSLISLISSENETEQYRQALYYITVYRIKGFTIDKEFLLLESKTRTGLGEKEAALYLENLSGSY